MVRMAKLTLAVIGAIALCGCVAGWLIRLFYIGRTSRQRRLIRRIFERVSELGSMEMLIFVNNCMPFLTTDLTSERIEKVILSLSQIKPVGFEELRIPIEGSYYDVRLRGMLVTFCDLKTNSEALRRFIYGY